MKIENRVEALELELKILKNEIQSTLLEIREQVLNHYYPELRAEEPARTKYVGPKPNEVRASKSAPARSNGNSRPQVAAGSPVDSYADSYSAIETKVQIQPFSDIFLQDMQDMDNDEEQSAAAITKFRVPDNFDDAVDDAGDDEIYDDMDNLDDELSHAVAPPARAIPKTREVNMQHFKQSVAAPKVRAVPERAEAVTPKTSRATFAALAVWVGESVAKVGKERTIQVVETYAASGGALKNETKSTLLQFASLATDVEPATPVGNQDMLGLMVGLDQILGDQ